MKSKILLTALAGLLLMGAANAQVINPSVLQTIPINTGNTGDAYAHYYKSTDNLSSGSFGSSYSIYVGYAINGSAQYFSLWSPPVVMPGQLFVMKILIPAGAKQIIAGAESNDWICAYPNCALLNGFDYNPGDSYCNLPSGDGTTCGSVSGDFFYQDALTIYSGGYNQVISATVTETAKWAYFILYNQNTTPFSLVTFNVNIMIYDTAAYNCWRNQRPWAGGPSGNSIDGIGEACTVGISDIVNDEVSLFPNPVSDQLTVNLALPGLFQLYDLTGKKIMSRQLVQGQNRINCKLLPEGVYFSKINSGDKIQSKKIIIKH